MQDSASFWTDIKNLDEQLAKSPDSFCFARLADVYLKVGLVDDALHVAQQGVLKHPAYLAGQRALALACHAKGLHDEALTALKLVTEAFPEDIASLTLFGRLSADAGNHDAAIRAFQTALEFAPDDVACRIELESLQRSAAVTEPIAEEDYSYDSDDDVIEDLEMLEEIDIIDDDDDESGYELPETPPVLAVTAPLRHDPLSTGTLAELYVTQGFIHKALEIYRAILADNPADLITAGRVAELEALEPPSLAPPSFEPDTESDEAFGDEGDFCFPAEEMLLETELLVVPVLGGVADFTGQQSASTDFEQECSTAVVPQQGTADKACATLEGWLENIGRMKLCR